MPVPSQQTLPQAIHDNVVMYENGSVLANSLWGITNLVNGNSNLHTIDYGYEYPFIVNINPQPNFFIDLIDVTNNAITPVTRTITYQNQGSSGGDFTGFINFSDNIACPDIQFKSCTVMVGTQVITFMNNINSGSFTLANIPCTVAVAQNANITIIETFNFPLFPLNLPCFKDCEPLNNKFTSTFMWGCRNNLGNPEYCVDYNSILTQSVVGNKNPDLVVHRTAPAPYGNAPDDGFWDDVNQSASNTWRFILTNEGDDIATGIDIGISPYNGSVQTLYYISNISLVHVINSANNTNSHIGPAISSTPYLTTFPECLGPTSYI